MGYENDLHKLLFDSLIEQIAVIDQEGIIVDVNCAWTNFGIENGHPSEVAWTGDNYLEVMSALDDCHVNEASQGILDVISGKAACYTFEYPSHSLGEQRWFLMRVLPIIGSSTALFAIFHQNITQHKLADEAHRIAAAAFETQEGIVVADAHKTILRVNHAFSRIFGYSAEEVKGNALILLRSERHDEGFYEELWETVHRKGNWQGELWEKRKNGEEFPLRLSVTAVADADGIITHYVGSFNDITGQKRAEKVLLDARERLEHQVASSQAELNKIKAETTEINAVLNVLIKHRETDVTDAQVALSREVESTVLPFLQKLKGVSIDRVQTIRLLDILETNLKQIVNSYGCPSELGAVYQQLTRVEAQVASMVRQGQPSKIIAATLNSSTETINIHRKRIRKKLGLDSKATNLQAYLMSLIE
jgi:PAS domain S-box-containing protein